MLLSPLAIVLAHRFGGICDTLFSYNLNGFEWLLWFRGFLKHLTNLYNTFSRFRRDVYMCSAMIHKQHVTDFYCVQSAQRRRHRKQVESVYWNVCAFARIPSRSLLQLQLSLKEKGRFEHSRVFPFIVFDCMRSLHGPRLILFYWKCMQIAHNAVKQLPIEKTAKQVNSWLIALCEKETERYVREKRKLPAIGHLIYSSVTMKSIQREMNSILLALTTKRAFCSNLIELLRRRERNGSWAHKINGQQGIAPKSENQINFHLIKHLAVAKVS